MEQVYIGSGDLAGAIGLKGHSRPKLWRKLLGKPTEAEQKAEESEITQSMYEAGNDGESLCIDDVEAITGLLFGHTGDNQKTVWKGRYRSTPDGLLDHPALGQYCLEAKQMTSFGKWTDPQPMHIAQCQLHCWVHEMPYCIFARRRVPEVTKVWRIHFSHRYINWMTPLVDEFLVCCDTDTVPKRLSKKTARNPPEVTIERIRSQECLATNGSSLGQF